jgi:hypothetical protein
MHVRIEAMLLVLRKAPRMLSLTIDGWREKHVLGLNVPAWRAW